ncbi:PAS domain-containing sensor histidine kinase [Ammoniphilus resinae]|uniref:histidine kinase n=1 Tax=Ammoniphilus resinae TaxID=861532 RepID=A0ABS4GX76_9BACL|nr:PAS domain-containing sensor histidine kinase [Ammoniphilus resinae]MBP1934707.1 two-component system sporulation sensor kinase A [Ammoniphilus resinae]
MSAPITDAFEILERIQDGFFALDQHWNFTYVNEKATRLLFRSRNDLVGKNVWQEFPKAVNLPFFEKYQQAVQEQTPVAFDAYYAPLDAWFDVKAYPSANGLSIYFQDVTKKKLEQQKHEELFHLITENTQDMISITSAEGRVVYVSPSIRTVLGYEPEEVIGSIRYDFWHPHDAKKFTSSTSMNHIDGTTFSRRVKHKNGHYVWVETSVSIKKDEQDEMIHAIGISRDITDRKLAENELRKTKERLQSFVQNNADAIWVINLEERVLEVNPAFETMFQWRAADVIGEQLPIIPDFMKELMDQIHQSVKAGISVASLETIRKRKDGTLLYVSATLSPITDSSGEVIGITGICRDVTPRKKAESTLQAKTQQLESFIETNEDTILVFNVHGTVQRANRAFERTFGWSKEEIIGVELDDLPMVPAGYRSEVRQYSEEVKAGRSLHGIEFILLRKDGVQLNVMVNLSPIYDGSGKVDGWASTIRDLTQWKKSQEMLQLTEKLSVAGQLAAGIAHEIRNPITAIKGFVQLMQSGMEDKKEYLDIMTSEIERIEQILSELLMLAKPQVSKFVRKDISLLLDQVVTLLSTQAILNDVEIVKDFEATMAFIECDENQIKQVFINYIKNAIDAMPSGGRLIIRTEKIDSKQMSISFCDNGVGMPEEVLAKLGQPFFTTKEKGTGLGFMISRKIIENHAGDVKIMSKVNNGTTIQVILPVEQGK